MKLFGYHILTQKALDERLSKVIAQTRKTTIALPNRIISKLLWQIHGPKKTLKQAVSQAEMEFFEKRQQYLARAASKK